MENNYKIKEDIYLFDFLKCISKKNINKLINSKAISVNKLIITNNKCLKKDEIITINFSLFETNEKEASYLDKIDIIYEDNDLIFVYKKPNMLIHSDGNTINTLLNRVVNYLKQKKDDSYVRCLHRIDYDAFGLVLFSKNIYAHSNVSSLFEQRKVLKKYQAVLDGILEKDGVINLKIARNRHDSRKYIVTQKGKEASLKYSILERSKDKTLVEVILITGRPHQIRVSFAHLNKSLVGDNLYGTKGKLQLLSKGIEFLFNNKNYNIELSKNLWIKS